MLLTLGGKNKHLIINHYLKQMKKDRKACCLVKEGLSDPWAWIPDIVLLLEQSD